MAKLTPEQGLELVRRYEDGATYEELMREFDVSRQTVANHVKKGAGFKTARDLSPLAVQMALNEKLVTENAILKEQIDELKDQVKWLRKQVERK